MPRSPPENHPVVWERCSPGLAGMPGAWPPHPQSKDPELTLVFTLFSDIPLCPVSSVIGQKPHPLSGCPDDCRVLCFRARMRAFVVRDDTTLALGPSAGSGVWLTVWIGSCRRKTEGKGPRHCLYILTGLASVRNTAEQGCVHVHVCAWVRSPQPDSWFQTPSFLLRFGNGSRPRT